MCVCVCTDHTHIIMYKHVLSYILALVLLLPACIESEGKRALTFGRM